MTPHHFSRRPFMLSTKFAGSVCAVALLATILATPAAAQPLDRRVMFTFSAPVVQVLSEDGKRAYGMFFAIPAQRPTPADTPEVRFMETPVGTPHAIRTWWYPADRTGLEFIYPKEQARLLAKSGNQPVLTTRAQTTTTAQTDTKDLLRISSSGQETRVDVAADPLSATPIGDISGGLVASPALEIPSHPIPAGPGPAQTHAPVVTPVVTMKVTLPDGVTQELTAPESGLATFKMKDGSEFGLRPTIVDSKPWNHVTVTIFRLGASTEELGQVEVTKAGSAMASKTTPVLTIAVTSVTLPSSE
jgi:hypothetical protein